MGNKKLKSQFNGGELSPEFYGMHTDAKFQAGVARMLNFIPLPHGPASNRQGTSYVAKTKSNATASRLITFNFGLSQAFAIEMGHKYFRFHYSGTTLRYPTSLPGRTVWSNAVAYVIGDLVERLGITYYAIKAGTNFPPESNSNYWYAQPSTGEYEIPSAYLAEDIFDVNYTQNADVLTLTCQGYTAVELRRYGNTRWIIENINFNAPISAPAAPTVTTSTAGAVAYSYVVTAVIDGSGESVASLPGSVNGQLYTSGAFNTITWIAVTGASRYNVFKLTGGLYGYIGSTTGLSIIDNNIAPDIGITPPLYDTPFTKSGAITAVAITNGGSGYSSAFSGGGFKSISVTHNTIEINDNYGILVEYLPERLPTLTALDQSGSGAVFTLNTRKTAIGDTGFGCRIYKTVFDITSAGTGYVSPSFVLYEPSIRGGVQVAYNVSYELTPIVQDVTIRVNDVTGYGAELIPVISGGVITGITVKKGGSNYTNPTITIVASSGSGFVAGAVTIAADGDNPGAVSYFDQRRVFAGSSLKPQNVWATRVGTEANMAYHIPILDDDRIAFRVSSREANFIKHIVPLSDMILMTSSAEWRVSSINSDSITPTSISVKPQSYIGCNNVQPIVMNSNAIFCAAKGGHVRELGFSRDSGGYITGDLSIRASHLFDGETIIDMCVTKTPFPIVWCISSSGRLLGLTYVPEQQVYAWFQCDTKDGVYESCCAVDDGDADALYLVVRRAVNGQSVRYIEKMGRRAFFSLSDCFFVDSGISYDGVATTTITGLSHLEGCKVAVLADGAVHPQLTVTGGQITLDVAASKVHVGIPITADIQTLPITLRAEAYGQGMIKNISGVWVRVNESSGISAGPDEVSLIEAKQRTTEPYDSPPDLISKELKIVPSAKWSDSGQVFIRQSDPLPLTIVSVTMEVTLGG